MTIDLRYYLQLSTSSGVPIYRQIIDQVKIHIAAGRLKAGDFLPSVRQVAKEMAINPMTVSKAYSQLEKEGVLENVRGQGMCVRPHESPGDDLHQREEALRPLLKETIGRAKQLSLNQKKLTDLIKDLWEE